MINAEEQHNEGSTPVIGRSPRPCFCPLTVRLRCLLHFLFQQFGNDLVDHLIGQRSYLVLGLGLDWVWDQDRIVLRHPQRSTLCMSCADELGGGHVGGRNPLLLKVDNIVRTARDAAPSIA